MKLSSFFPITDPLRSHKLADWRKDIVAGIMVAVLLVPQGMAYAMLAGLPPIYGLYGGLVPLLIYGLMGTSRQMSVGPVAVSALLVLAGVSQLAPPESPEYIQLVILTGLGVGVLQFLLGLVRLGFLVNFISHPIIVGFTSAAAIIIAISQLKDVLGFTIPRFAKNYDTFLYALQHLDQTHWPTLGLSLGSIVLIVILRKLKKSLPGALIVLVLGTLLVYGIGATQYGIRVVGEVPEGLPAFAWPQIGWAQLKILLPTILTVTTIGIVESISIARVYQSRHPEYNIHPNQELIALGLSKIFGSFFQALPTSGSFSRSAVNEDNGARSGIASLVTALLVGLTLLFLTPLFYYLPQAVLAGIILLAVKGLFDWQGAMELWKTDRPDFVMMLATFLVTLIFGIEEGVFAGVLLSILMVLYRSSRPHVAVLGKLPNTNSYRNIQRFEDAAQPEEVLVVRFDDQLYFGNAAYFQEVIRELADEKGDGLQLLVINAGSIHELDSTGVHALEQLVHHFQQQQIEVYFAGFIGPVRDKLLKCGLMEKIGEQRFFLNVHSAITSFQNLQRGEQSGWNRSAIQSNLEEEA
ncbi:MAG: solute carrier family 26 protein [Bacteroidota bacterium]